jgi:drug/metabolite transporter (DMT)-like permease
MSLLALTLVLAAAFMHAGWNLLAKRAAGGPTFVWLFSALAAIIYLPAVAVLLLIERPHLGTGLLIGLVGSPMLNLVYFLLLQRGYRAGDLSLVYPLARGTGPLLTTVVAMTLLGERPVPLALTGTALIAIGVAILASSAGALRGAAARRAMVYGLLTGASIASYTLWDKQAVAALLIPPLLLDWAIFAGQAVLLTPIALRHHAEVRMHWRIHRREALGVAVLSPLAYVLVLSALVFTPVSYVAPAREISILIGVVMGARLLAEEHTPRRLVAAGAMVVGIGGLALA